MQSVGFLCLLLTACLAASCGARGSITVDSAAAAFGAVQPIYAAISRTASQGADLFGRERAEVLGFARFDVAVPPDREPGTLSSPTTCQPIRARTI